MTGIATNLRELGVDPMEIHPSSWSISSAAGA
jgi:hypothetical protein